MNTDQNQATVTKVNGCPGGGKTRSLLQHVEQYRDDGYGPGEIYYLTFTRSGRNEVADRLLEVFADADEEDIRKRAKTVHGAACVSCLLDGVIEDTGEQIIMPGKSDELYQRFCNQHGLSFSSKTKDPLRLAQEGQDVEHSGNSFFGLYNWLKYTQKPYEKHGQAPIGLAAGHQRTIELLEAWDRFKKHAEDKRLFEHADYVDEAIQLGLTPPANVLFIDEFQDLSPQEYRLFKTWRDSGVIEQIYIAGDANQSIYSFRAGTPLYFRETDIDDLEDRRVSYRCPEEIVSVGRAVLDMHPETSSNGFKAKFTGGTAERRVVEHASELATQVRKDIETHEENDDGNTLFLLARTNRQAGVIGNALEEEGVPISFLGRDEDYQPWSDPLPALYKGLEAIADGRNLNYAPRLVQIRMLDHLPDSDRSSEEKLLHATEQSPLEVAQQLDLYYSQRERLKNAIEKRAYTDPDAVTIGTIHKAKGLEAPCVYLFDTIGETVYDAYHNGGNAAEEHRLFYVGATRASKTLRVITGFDGLGDRVFPAFDGGLPRDDGEVVA